MVNNNLVLLQYIDLKFMDHYPKQIGIVANIVMPAIMSNRLGE